ncbi:MAG: FHA domain-containing protein [Xanthomonadales bacterium]|nr:FHA domain-containing protein [Xanthomonadales bacterium]
MSGIRRHSVILLLCLGALAIVPTMAQDTGSRSLAPAPAMPAWLVPVLRLVSSTHVEPTTGIVMPGGELVLVPAAFASAGDELVVLDGGTDIVRNGRTARIVQRFPDLGLQALAVEGLKRPGASFPADAPQPGATLRLMAFPPAEEISAGAPPLNVEAPLASDAGNGQAVIRVETPLPNVTGALVDSCGNLVASSVADGVQSMSTAAAPDYRWTAALLRIVGELRLEAVYRPCMAAQATESAGQTETAPEPEPPAEAAETPEAAAGEVPEEERPAVATPEETISAETGEVEEAAADEVLAQDEPPVAEAAEEVPDAPDATDEQSTGPAWSWLLVLAALVAGMLFLRRRRVNDRADGASEAPAEEERNDRNSVPGTGRAIPTHDSRMSIHGVLADGTPFEESIPVSREAVDLVIGRGGADLNIASPAVSRAHARLSGSAQRLLLSDLGSSNGTSINGVPCLEGETFYLEPDDCVVLGDAQFQVDLEAEDDSASAKR